MREGCETPGWGHISKISRCSLVCVSPHRTLGNSLSLSWTSRFAHRLSITDASLARGVLWLALLMTAPLFATHAKRLSILTNVTDDGEFRSSPSLPTFGVHSSGTGWVKKLFGICPPTADRLLLLAPHWLQCLAAAATCATFEIHQMIYGLGGGLVVHKAHTAQAFFPNTG